MVKLLSQENGGGRFRLHGKLSVVIYNKGAKTKQIALFLILQPAHCNILNMAAFTLQY